MSNLTDRSATISIVVPVRNGQDTISECLKSVLAQSQPFEELIVVDNNSTDQTAELVEILRLRDSRIKYIKEKLVARGSARQTGLEQAQSTITVMIDADCVAPQNWLEKLTGPILKSQAWVVAGGLKPQTDNFWTRQIEKSDRHFNTLHLDSGNLNHLPGANFAILTDLAKQAGFNRFLVSREDVDFYNRLPKHVRVKYISDAYVKHPHPTTGWQVIKMNYNRGWWAQTAAKHQAIFNHPQTQNIYLTSKMLLPLHLGKTLLTKPIQDTWFIMIYDTSWHLGSLIARIKSKKQMIVSK